MGGRFRNAPDISGPRVRCRAGGRRLALSVLTAVVASSCGGSGTSKTAAPTTTTTTLASSVPAGFTGFTDAVDRFTISTPADWRQIDPSSPGAAQFAKDLVSANPAFAPALGSGNLAAQGMKFFAADASSGASVNVIVKALPGVLDSDLPKLADQIKAQYAQVDGTVTGIRSVQLSGRAAVRVSLDLRISGPTGAKSTVQEVQYLVAANDLVYILTFAGDSPRLAPIGDTFRVN